MLLLDVIPPCRPGLIRGRTVRKIPHGTHDLQVCAPVISYPP